MPIKFRCQHCRQFLGISRAKAGEVFDCPTCGWTLRVPDLDGTIKPLPGPGLDLGDSKLAQALDELASIDGPARADAVSEAGDGSAARSGGSAARGGGGTGVEGRVIDDRKGDSSRKAVSDAGNSSGAKDNSGGAALPPVGFQTMAEPIELPPLPAPEPIDVKVKFRARRPLRPEDDNEEQGNDSNSNDGEDEPSEDARPWQSTAQAGNSWCRLLAAAEFGLAEGDSTDEPVKEAEPVAVAAAGVSPSEPAQSAIPSPAGSEPAGILRLSGATWFAMVGIGAVLLAVGFWAGRVTTLPPQTQSVEAGSKLPVDDAPPNAASADGSIETRYTAFRGRITYRNESGDRKADKGARVIVLPVERKGNARLSVSGLRAGDQPDDRKLAETGIQTLGGDVATTNDDGEFEIQLSGSGQFYLLALSNSLSREDDADDTAAEEALAVYFERPSQLLGRVMFCFEKVRHSGDGVTPWDYSFAQP
jgi:hypothetical protein